MERTLASICPLSPYLGGVTPAPHQSDSAVQRSAEKHIIDALAISTGIEFDTDPGRITLAGGVWVEVDARSNQGSVFVKAYARQGKLKGAQIKKIGPDILKLALLRRKEQNLGARAIIAFASQEASDSIRGWLRRAAEEFGVELMVVEIDQSLREQILAAQNRQIMVNVDATVVDVVEDLEPDTELK